MSAMFYCFPLPGSEDQITASIFSAAVSHHEWCDLVIHSFTSVKYATDRPHRPK